MQCSVLTLQDIRLKPGSDSSHFPFHFPLGARLLSLRGNTVQNNRDDPDFLVVAAAEPDLVEKQRKSPSWEPDVWVNRPRECSQV